MFKLSKYRELSLPSRLCYGLLALSTLWLLAVGLWEIAAPFGAGHVAVLPARAIMADNMVQHGILYPVRAYSLSVPAVSDTYAHHPWGTYYLFALVRLLFGRHEWAIRLVPVCLSVAMPSLLFFVAKRLWGQLAGAVAALGWAVLPIALAFAQFPSFEMFALAGCLGVTWMGLRYREKPTRGRLVALLGVTLLAANTDWIASLYVLLAAVTALLLCVFWPRADEQVRELRRLLQGLISCTLVVIGTLLFYVVLLRQLGLLEDLLSSSENRARGNELPFTEVFAQRRYWLEIMFTQVGLLVGALGALLMFARLLWLRRSEELWPLVLLAVSTFHYVHFKNGADVHIYWPLPFAAQFCLSLGVIAVSVESLLSRWRKAGAPLLRPQRRLYWSLGATGLLALLVFPDGLRALDYARDTGCRLNDDGQLNLQDYDKNLALGHFKAQIPKHQWVALNSSLFPNWSQDYALERATNLRGPGGRSAPSSGYTVFDLRYASPTVLTWARGMYHQAVGPYLLVNSLAEAGTTTALGFREQRPNWLKRYFVQAHDPEYSIVADPYLTWELREHQGVKVNPIPPGLDQPEHRVVAHNVAVSQKDEARRAKLLASIEQGLDRSSAHRYPNGLRLLGHRLIPGTPPRLEVYFLAAGPLAPDSFFAVRSRVVAPPRFSFVVADDKEKQYGTGFVLNPSLWKPGMLYVSRMEVRERPGFEHFDGRWMGKTYSSEPGWADVVPLFERP